MHLVIVYLLILKEINLIQHSEAELYCLRIYIFIHLIHILVRRNIFVIVNGYTNSYINNHFYF